jgi:hypothetical protein
MAVAVAAAATGLLAACAGDPEPGYDEAAWCGSTAADFFFATNPSVVFDLTFEAFYLAIADAAAMAPDSIRAEADTVVVYAAGMAEGPADMTVDWTEWEDTAVIGGVTHDQYREAFDVIRAKWQALCE